MMLLWYIRDKKKFPFVDGVKIHHFTKSLYISNVSVRVQYVKKKSGFIHAELSFAIAMCSNYLFILCCFFPREYSLPLLSFQRKRIKM